MKDCTVKGDIKVLGVDLSKNSIQLHGINESGKPALKKNSAATKLLHLLPNYHLV